jgi:hypothetical protein
MGSRSLRESSDRYGKRKSHARPDRIIEKRPSWQDYLDPEEDPGLLDDEEALDLDEREPGDENPENDAEQPEKEDPE